ncbi:MAG: hypothetical protein HRT68_09140, partial [Flavobacteriaceae bacterium]|nr:hypothetical protein [Flavobacteriaceae bacterium]
PGCIAYDFGDAVRTMCTRTKEDFQKLQYVRIKLSFFEAFTRGFSLHLKSKITDAEINSLFDGVKLMPFIMGLRFFTDFMNGNQYYKITFPKQNLVRARNQFKLYTSILDNQLDIQEIIKCSFKR